MSLGSLSGLGCFMGALCMPFRYVGLEKYLGKVIGSGQCVEFVKLATGAPQTSGWKRGQLVKGNPIPMGTAIATFDPDGKYGNHEDGTSHAAILLSQDARGLRVLDQWAGTHPSPVHERVIAFDDLKTPVNNGNNFFVIEPA